MSMMMRSACGASIILWLVFSPLELSAQSMPRQLSEDDLARLRRNVEASKVRSIEAGRQAELARQKEAIRQREEALAYEEEEDWDEEDWGEQVAPAAGGGFADVLSAFTGTLASEMEKGRREDAQRQRFLDGVRRDAEAVDRQRRREEERQRLAQERVRLEQRQRSAAPVGMDVSATGAVQAGPGDAAAEQQRQAQLREQQLRERAAAERQRLSAAQAETQRGGEAAQRHQAEEQASQRRQQELAQSLQHLRSSFQGEAVTCAGGGKDVLYLRSSMPPRTLCNRVGVRFEARCPGEAPGTGVHFSRIGYIGSSCSGESIRIGHMDCAAEQVRIAMTDARCE